MRARADVVVVTTDNPRSERPGDIVTAVLAGMRLPERARVIPNRKEAIVTALSAASPDDVSQVTPLLMKAGGEMLGRYGVVEQLGGEGGPKAIAIMKFPSAQAIKDALSSDDFKALAGLRDAAMSRVDQMLCSAL